MKKRVYKIKKFNFVFIIIILIIIGGCEVLQENRDSKDQSKVAEVILESMNKDGGFIGFNQEKKLNYYNTFYNRALLKKDIVEIDEVYKNYIKEDFNHKVDQELSRASILEFRYLSELVSKHQISLGEEEINRLISKLKDNRKDGLYWFSKEEGKEVEKVSTTLDALIIINNITGETPKIKKETRSSLFESIKESENKYKASLYTSYKKIIELQGTSLSSNERKEIEEFVSKKGDINFAKNPEEATLQTLYLSQLSDEIDFEGFNISDEVYKRINRFKTTDDGFNMYSESNYDPKLTYEINKYLGVELSSNLTEEIQYTEISPTLYTENNINSNIIQTYRAIKTLDLMGEKVPKETTNLIEEFSTKSDLSARDLYYLLESRKLLGLSIEDFNLPSSNESLDSNQSMFYNLSSYKLSKDKDLKADFSSMKNNDGGYGQETSTLYETYLIVDNIPQNKFTSEEKEGIIDFVMSRENEDGFGKGKPSLDKTYHAIKILEKMGYSDIEGKISKAKKLAKQFKNETGTYSEEKGGSENNLRATYYGELIEKIS
ncbi:hypothetical protein [Halobacillus sp. A5]|uniref:prenyltransferase/squalene oxidase repeat-containing protein n=1 Tax=Halobacillus sp. A5 TaxID=2880263 RepID=UPI0020A6250A|nr:hypothetical protein [Halobacillus sp. A5]MCP3026590.1 hypothetical protein [Halobacillus sp. A5]